MQTNYKLEMDPALVGQIADLSNHTIDSFAAEAGLDAGVPVKRGTDPTAQVLPVSAEGDAADAIGIVIHEHKEHVAAGQAYYPEQYVVGVMTKGRIWVQTGGAVTAGAAAKYNVTDGTFVENAPEGEGDEDSEAVVEELGCGAKFITSTTAAGLAVIEIG